MEKSKESGKNELIQLFDKVKKELDARKAENHELRNLIGIENNKRAEEAQAIKDKLEREKEELRNYIEQDKKNISTKIEVDKAQIEKQLADEADKIRKDKEKLALEMKEENSKVRQKLDQEVEEKRRQKELLDNRLKKNENEKNEILQLYEKMRTENESRKRENEQLSALFGILNAEKDKIVNKSLATNSELKGLIKRNIEKLEKEFKKQSEEGTNEIGSLRDALSSMEAMLKRPPLYFNAFREEPYVTGGEEYLTFTDCSVNAGEAFFPKSGIFLAPYPGIGCGCSYLLTLSPHS